MNVILKDDTEILDEVVVIGYGQVKKNDMTGSVMAIKPDELSKGITTNAQDMLSGKIAGVSVISNDGTPGGGAQIRIRGGSSLNASNDPLIVIDGISPCLADNWKLPSKSVIVPVVVPFTTTLAPITGSPVASFTIPLTAIC